MNPNHSWFELSSPNSHKIVTVCSCNAWLLRQAIFILFFSSSNGQQNVVEQSPNSNGVVSSPQKPGGFKFFQSSNNNGNSNNQNSSTSSANVVGQAQQNQPNSGAPHHTNVPPPQQPNGILKNSYDREAMSRVGQRWDLWIISDITHCDFLNFLNLHGKKNTKSYLFLFLHGGFNLQKKYLRHNFAVTKIIRYLTIEFLTQASVFSLPLLS